MEYLLTKLSVEVTEEDLDVIGKAASAVYCRAAKLIAIGIAALVREVNYYQN